MHAIVTESTGGPEVLRMAEVPVPTPRPGELLVRVHATALNRADLLQREGKYPPPPGASPLLGLEIAGEVVAWGEGVTGWASGERVAALLSGGGYAQYATVPAGHAFRLPDALAFEDAAAIPEAFLTAFQALVLLADVQSGDHVLVHAGASGVGTAAIQLARHLGARVYTTASAGKLDALEPLGADVCIDYEREDFAEKVLDASGGHGADVIVDVIGAPYVDQHLRCLALDGRWVVLATMGGSMIEHFDLRKLFAKRGTLVTSTLRNRSDAYKADLVARFSDACLSAFADRNAVPGNRRGVRLGATSRKHTNAWRHGKTWAKSCSKWLVADPSIRYCITVWWKCRL